MKLNRSALMAGILALGVAGCGDDVQIVEPTPPVAPPPPPVTASMAPASASVLIGNSVVFAVNASGGVAGEAASWSCASSNTGVATVSVTGAGCQATGVVAGSVTVTATVTKSGETVNVGAQLTVTEEATGEPAFLILKGVSGEMNSDASGLKGRVSVSLGVERGDQTLERISVLVDGAEVSYQSFGSSMDMGMAAPEDGAAEQAVYDFTLSFDSDGYDAQTGAPDYMNGDHSISAELQIAGGMMADGMMGHETISSNVLSATFDNDDGYVVTADLGHNSALDDKGRRWYGGPDNEHVVISVLPVSYSGAEVTDVTLGLTGCEVDEDHSEALSAEFDCEGEEAARTISVSSAGQDGTILNEDDLPEANIDMMAPTEAPIIIANRNGREGGWINAAVGIAGEYHAKNAKDNWLVMGVDTTAGVGGYNMAIRIGEDLEEAVGDDATSSLPAESADNSSYCAVAVASDDLGNMTALPDADEDTCRPAPPGTDVLVDDDKDSATDEVWGYLADPETISSLSLSTSTLAFGVDTTAPTIEFSDDHDKRFSGESSEIAIAFDPNDDESNVGNSGLLEKDGLEVMGVMVQRRGTSKTECLVIGPNGLVSNDAQEDDGCDAMIITGETIALTPGASPAYYTASGTATDQAGNSSNAISHVFVYDNEVADATDPAVPGVIEAGTTFTGTTYLNDNLSIRDYYGTANYGDSDNYAAELGIGLPVEVDAFNAASLTSRNVPVTATVGIHTTSGVMAPYAALQSSVGDPLLPMSSVSVFVRDQTQMDYGNGVSRTVNQTGVPDTTAAFGDGAFDFHWIGRRGESGVDSTYDVCALPGGCGDDDATTEDEEDFKTSLKIEVAALAPAAGTFRDPFERVDFYVQDVNGASWLVGSDTSGTSGREGGDIDGSNKDTAANDRYRTWSYSVTVPGAMIEEAVRRMTATAEGAGNPMIVVVAVNDENVGLVKKSAVNISSEKP